MASQWYSFTDEESGPYSFEQLAEMIAQGELLESDLVRRVESSDWQRVDKVFGLMRAASNRTSLQSKRIPERQHGKLGVRLVRFIEQCLPRWNGEWVVVSGSLLLILCCLIVLGWTWWQWPVRFPTGPVSVQMPSRLGQLRPPPPARPTLPQLPIGEPILVPGFEQITWLKSPTLSADLLTIVYVRYSGDLALDDLFIAERKSMTEPFQNHHVIPGANSSAREAHPSLSPDGRELIFARLGSPTQLWRTSRADGHSTFENASELVLRNDSFKLQHHDAPQFLDANTLRITQTDTEYSSRTQWAAVRYGNQGEFRLTEPIEAANPWLRYFLTRQARRAYAATQEGLVLTARLPRSEAYVIPDLLFGTQVTGPELTLNDDTIWVSSAEDLIFYCGPGPDPQDSSNRRLWMIRF